MATFFGEVIPISTRAYDEEEDEETVSSVNVKLSMNSPGQLNCSALIVAQGALACDFAESVLKTEDTKIIGSIEVERERIEKPEYTEFHARMPVPCHLYQTPTDVIICIASKDVTADVANKFSEKILSVIQHTAPVVVISSHHCSALLGHYASGEDCIIKSLKSPEFNFKTVFPRLPQPATLDSVPAAILTSSIVTRRPCVIYAIYTEAYSTGDLDLIASPLMTAFKCEPFKTLVSQTLDKSKLQSYRRKNVRQENIDRYM
ncbi:proteasome assembly chaperone 1-like [Oratosquilla oratoria]|uniref:proteasome assembly chaperone 1-like n=1 Tax=Oratosquilla oratoria TaxID=337810 RepID=UPI003F7751AB